MTTKKKPFSFAIMKFFTIFMAIYISLLTGVPCSDSHNDCHSSSKTEIAHSHNHSQDHKDYCSPFCNCSCCGMALFAFAHKSIRFIEPNIQTISVKESNYKTNFVSNFFGSIWQPPKISINC